MNDENKEEIMEVDPKYKRYKINAIENKGPEIRGLRVPKEYHDAIKSIIRKLFAGTVTPKRINSATNALIIELLK